MKTIVGLFPNTSAAQEVKKILISNDYAASDIKIVAADHDDVTATSGTGAGIGEKISGFFHGLSGGDEQAHTQYARGVNEGGALLTVKTDDEDVDEMVALMKQYGARDIEGSIGGNTAAREVTGQTAIPIVEEELVVGKREVDRGGVRVYSHVVETPVQAQVDLHEERVNVTRRAVDRQATAADFEVGNRSSFELRATGEEAVVGKASRVVEEVLVGKQGSDRTETVSDSVRRTEVEVEQIPGKFDDKLKR